MDRISSNLLHTPSPNEPKESRKVILLLLVALVFLIISASAGGLLFASSAGLKPSLIFAKLRSLTLAKEKKLQGEEQNRVNLLLLGMGGAGHEGATLTDTLVFTSLRPSDGAIGLLSIPRDLQVEIPGYGYRRINSVNAYAELKERGSGGIAAAAMVSKTLGEPVHYYLRVDFEAFKEIIDTVGGIEVEVERAFYDPFYPDENFGYAPISFEAGKQLMSGERALKFVRSRHGTNGEGSDFARARRQQKVLFALKGRLLSFDVLLRPKRIKHIVESLEDHLKTNIAFWEGLRLAKLLRQVERERIESRVLDASPDGVLQERNYNGAFVLEPKGGAWEAVRTVAAGLLDKAPPASPALPAPPSSPPLSSPAPQPTVEKPIVEIQNGTTLAGLAARTAEKLEALGFNAASIGNASLRNVERTVLYDLTGGQKTEEFKKLKETLGAIDGEGEPLHLISKGGLDFVVILGENTVQ